MLCILERQQLPEIREDHGIIRLQRDPANCGRGCASARWSETRRHWSPAMCLQPHFLRRRMRQEEKTMDEDRAWVVRLACHLAPRGGVRRSVVLRSHAGRGQARLLLCAAVREL